jgi:hypothetical protein
MREDRVGVDPDLAHDRLVARRDDELSAADVAHRSSRSRNARFFPPKRLREIPFQKIMNTPNISHARPAPMYPHTFINPVSGFFGLM